ncbi:hypothetical protein CJU89_5315 [Yarrowia sp. B02]|nr:hypothetical protein CJU89_5315 [Yarrowia sp. B02]
MKLQNIFALAAVAVAAPQPLITPGPVPVEKRDDQAVLGADVWIQTLDNGHEKRVTPTVIDGVTISGKPMTEHNGTPTPWNSLDSTGIPYRITPSIKKEKDHAEETISASPTAPSGQPQSTDTPPVLGCWGDRVPEDNEKLPGYPFCSPHNGTELVAGETYWVTWDTSYWGGPDITQVKIILRSLPTDTDDLLFETEAFANKKGYYPLEIQRSWARNGGYFFINIAPLTRPDTKAKNVGTKAGPIVRAILNKDDGITTVSRLPSDNSLQPGKKHGGIGKGGIAAAVVVPVVVVILLSGLGFLYYRQKKTKQQMSNDRWNPAENVRNMDPMPPRRSDVSLDRTISIDTAHSMKGDNPFEDR